MSKCTGAAPKGSWKESVWSGVGKDFFHLSHGVAGSLGTQTSLMDNPWELSPVLATIFGKKNTV